MSKVNAIVVETAKGFMLEFEDGSRDHFIHSKEVDRDNGMTRGQYFRAMKSNFGDDYKVENPPTMSTKAVDVAELPSDIKDDLENAFGPVPNFGTATVEDEDPDEDPYADEQAYTDHYDVGPDDDQDDYAVDPDGVVYSKSQLSEADIESVEEQLEIDEEEVEESPQPIVEPIKTHKEMEQQTTAPQEQQVQQPVTMFTKVNWYSRKTAGAVTFGLGTSLHTPAQGATNIGKFIVKQMQKGTDLLRDGEALIIHKLDITDDDRDQIKQAIDDRAKAILTAPQRAVKSTVKAIMPKAVTVSEPIPA